MTVERGEGAYLKLVIASDLSAIARRATAEAKQSRLSPGGGILDCFVALLLAMTKSYLIGGAYCTPPAFHS
ncbi:hypothetical protein ABIA96_001326 [Bradyrhizobium sp. LB11.1]